MKELRSKALMLPQKPGVYIMKDVSGKVIYVGKAKILPNRVSQYFADLASHNAKTRKMVSQVHDFDTIIAGSEFEALTLENTLIKQHMPKYNILLKDDKGYPYIRLGVKDDYPRLSIVSAPSSDGAQYYGPYAGRSMATSIIEALCHVLKLPDCSRRFPQDIGKNRPCLNRDMDRCEGWCTGCPDQKAYLETIERAKNMLKGDYAAVADEIKVLMHEAAERLEFERAANLRDRYNSVLKLGQRQSVACGSLAQMDACAWSNGPTGGCFAVLHYNGGILSDRDVIEAENVLDQDESAVLSELLCRYYLARGFAPRTVLVPALPEDWENISRLLSEKSGHKVTLQAPQRGEKLSIVRLAQTNAAEEAQKATDRRERQTKTLQALGKMLSMEEYPARIEAYDISNTAGDNNVAAMTVFVSGKPLKRDYRLFKIKGFSGQDDYGSLSEAITRRFTRLKEGGQGAVEAPDLLLIDGGRGQTAVARQAML
ncbi:MAG: excinuclease ABC subunit UvrC, partial [Oscillospiraceae bacterium]|nr:excinuclease ABC subunit UvrC [Oscillospiraceae bacterium]